MKPDSYSTTEDPASDDYDDDTPSKSQVKREMLALLDLGHTLIELSPDRLKQLPIAERLYDAIREAQRTTSREGKRRQAAYVGKLMRDAPADEIRRQLEVWAKGSKEETAAMHRLELMRERLLADDEALTRLLTKYPSVDAQALRSQIRAARKEEQANQQLQPGQDPQRKQYRALFQTLKNLPPAGATE